MALVTGILADFAQGTLGDQHPTFLFEPSGPGFNDPKVHAPERAKAAPVLNGGFSIDLQPNDVIHPATHYTVTILWGSGRRVRLPWKLFVPSSGGRLADLLQYPANPASTWIGTTPPTNPSPGTWWLNPETGELQEWSN